MSHVAHSFAGDKPVALCDAMNAQVECVRCDQRSMFPVYLMQKDGKFRSSDAVG